MLTYLLVLIYIPLFVNANAAPTKLCADEKCSQKLFSTTAVRIYGATHSDFLSLKENETIDVYAIKMSNRPDIIEGMNSEGKRGLLYLNFVDRLGYIFYLMQVVEDNVEMYEVKQTLSPGETALVKKRNANPYLWRDYNVQRKLQNEVEFKDIPMLPDPEEKKKGHHHHHHGHDHHHHHHDHDHDHSHEEIKASEEGQKPEVVPTIDPLKKISLQAMKEAQKLAPEATPTPPTVAPPSPVESPPPAGSENNIEDELVNTIEKTLENTKISPDIVNSIIEETAKNSQEIVPEDPKPSEIKDNVENLYQEVTMPPVEATTIPDPMTTTDRDETAVPTTAPVMAVTEPLEVKENQIPPLEQLITPAPEVQPESQELPNLEAPTTPVPVVEEVPTAQDTVIKEVPIQNTVAEEPSTAQDTVIKEVPTAQDTVTEEVPIRDTVAEEPPTTPAPVVEEPPIALASAEIPASTVPSVVEEKQIDPSSEEVKKTSVLQEEIKEIKTGNKMNGYCYDDDCSTNSENPNGSETTGFVATNIRPIAKSVAYAIRSTSFYPVNEFDDTGIFVLLFFGFTFVLYLFNWFFQDGGKKDILDRRALHDALTRIKEQQVQIEQLRKNAADPQIMAQYTGQIEKLRNDYMNLKQENDKLNYSIQQKQTEFSEIAQEKNRLQSDFQQISTEKSGLEREYDNVVQKHKEVSEELRMVRTQLTEANERQATSVSEIQDLRKTINELENNLHDTESNSSNLKIKLDAANEKIEDLEKQLRNRKKTEEEYIEVIEELQKKIANVEQKPTMNQAKVESVGSGESNASNGWSDMDLGDLDVPEEKQIEEEPVAKKPVKVATLGKKNKKEISPEQERKISKGSSDIMEVVSLRKELKSLEVERDELKRELKNEQKTKELIEMEIDQLKKNLAEKKADLERTATDKDYFRTQSETLQQKLEEASYKIEKLQQDKEKMFDLEKEIIKLSGERSEASIKIKELEKQLNKAEEDNKKIELRFFSEQRRLQSHILNLENKALMANVHDGIGSGNSSDRDYSLMGTNNGQSNNEIRSLWTDVDAETSFDDGLIPSDHRRKSRGFYDQIPSGRRSAGRDTQRRRSRSAGRNRGSGVSSPNFLPQPFSHNSSRASPMNAYDRHSEHRSSKRISRGGHQTNALYYSSDGSNGLSPPPEMPSQSGIAPTAVLLHKPTPRT